MAYIKEIPRLEKKINFGRELDLAERKKLSSALTLLSPYKNYGAYPHERLEDIVYYALTEWKNYRSTYRAIRAILIKAKIIKKFKYCEICNLKKDDNQLVIHEKTYDMDRLFLQKNYSTLCHSCHSKYSIHHKNPSDCRIYAIMYWVEEE